MGNLLKRIIQQEKLNRYSAIIFHEILVNVVMEDVWLLMDMFGDIKVSRLINMKLD